MTRGVPHPPDLALRVLARRAEGATTYRIAHECGLPHATVARWCRGLLSKDAHRALAGEVVPPRCEKCGGYEHSGLIAHDYAYLLGVYLGDGCLAKSGRTIVLRIVLDTVYPAIVEEVTAAILAVRGEGKVSAYDIPGQRCVALSSCTRAWLCLFPQHGKGRKHLRPIRLEPWQWELVREEPGRFLRGLIHSDGWRGVNKVHVKGRDYEYPRYQFSSRSDDIRGLFTLACDELGVAWRPWGRYHISVARRASVALLDEHVGPKQ